MEKIYENMENMPMEVENIIQGSVRQIIGLFNGPVLVNSVHCRKWRSVPDHVSDCYR